MFAFYIQLIPFKSYEFNYFGSSYGLTVVQTGLFKLGMEL